MRPTNPLLRRMFSPIHAETDPHTTRTRPSRFEKPVSQAFLRNAAKPGS